MTATNPSHGARSRLWRPTPISAHAVTFQTVPDTEDVWSIACFYIRSGFRRQGLTTPLIEAAIDYARDNGAKIIEAYPVDYDSPSYSYMGRIGTFERLGFKEIAMAGTRRHIMRLQL